MQRAGRNVGGRRRQSRGQPKILSIKERLSRAITLFPRKSLEEVAVRNVMELSKAYPSALDAMRPSERRGYLISRLKWDFSLTKYNVACEEAGRPELKISISEAVEWILNGFEKYRLERN